MSHKTHYSKNNSLFKVGVIGGTHFDTMLGTNYLKKLGISALPFPISKNPEDQTRLQLDKSKLQYCVSQAISTLQAQGVTCIFIYCNSLSGSLDVDQLRDYFHMPIITPLEVYEKLAKSYKRFAVIAANGQSLASIERILLSNNNNPDCIVIGMGHLALVDAVENAKSPLMIIESFKLVEQCQLFQQQHCECIILGCTHFNYFVDELLTQLEKVNCTIDIIDPTQKLLEHILEIQKS